MPRISNAVLLVTLLVVCFSCDNKQVFDAYQSTDKRWHKDSIIQFQFQAPDTLNSYNLFVNLRNTHEYPYNNLYLITTLTFPHGKTIRDTLEYRMAAPNGELLGSGFSDIKENKLWYKGHMESFVFEESGDYTLGIQHAMRKNGSVDGDLFLEGVTDVGFRIEQKD
ncbi:gliding motility lipoprotein GldH [Winogradskyella aurantiaca]|uniref:gliding motility lipoprotein GldH n=1 Tax=Winogradskyella aurantiaca TaxID=2219558 RepID=UPI000E1C80CE|nr:gliding motility lipoprotein GldH [Winogradskyella aurantiaca]